MSEKIRNPGRQPRHADNVAQSSRHTANPAARNGTAGACPEPAATTLSRMGSGWPFASREVSPLGWWRTFPADMFADAERLLLAATLDTIRVMDGHKGVAAALRGDAATAVQVALSLLPLGEITLRIDIAMTALLRCAVGGDAAAALVLANVLSRLKRDQGLATGLSASWGPPNPPARRGVAPDQPTQLPVPRRHAPACEGGAS